MSPTPGPRQVVLMAYSVDGRGGVARAVVNLANQLAVSHDVEIVSVVDRPRGPKFDLDPSIRLTYLQTLRKKAPRGLAAGDHRWRNRPGRNLLTRWLDSRPTSLIGITHAGTPGMTRWADLLIRRRIRSLRDCVLITTRPSLHVAAARWARPGVVRIGHDHGNFVTRSQSANVAPALREALASLDAFVVLTRGDLDDYAQWFPEARERLVHIPNPSPYAVGGELAALTAPIAISGGRLTSGKAFPRMVRAFADVADQHPEWQLHIHGAGDAEATVREAIARHGMEGRVVLKGFTHDFDAALREASMFLMTSRSEGFPMVLLEAMAVGLPLVAYDVPRGPADLIEDGVTGRLLADDDRAGFSEALHQLMGDADLRRRMGRAGAEAAARYAPERIRQRWLDLVAELTR